MPKLPTQLGRITTCDVYHSGSPPPPSAPDIAGVILHLQGDFANTKIAPPYTHLGYVALTVDLRDTDAIYVPDKNGTNFNVQRLGRIRTGGGQDVRKVYLTRNTPNWPSQNL
ncbi:MAG TPA: hypothetical protein VKE94_21665 [Gemmataceae bacterium]|nr:hypothetical protein [Gemmataceae bacterium]